MGTGYRPKTLRVILCPFTESVLGNYVWVLSPIRCNMSCVFAKYSQLTEEDTVTVDRGVLVVFHNPAKERGRPSDWSTKCFAQRLSVLPPPRIPAPTQVGMLSRTRCSNRQVHGRTHRYRLDCQRPSLDLRPLATR